MRTIPLTRLLVPLAWAVFIAGWAIAVIAFLVIGTENCASVEVPLAGGVEVCQDTTAQAVILFAVVGFMGTLAALFLWALRYVLVLLERIESNTR